MIRWPFYSHSSLILPRYTRVFLGNQVLRAGISAYLHVPAVIRWAGRVVGLLRPLGGGGLDQRGATEERVNP